MVAKKKSLEHVRPDLTDVTRIDIVTELGRYEFWADSWRYDEQDEGRTLKLFGKGEGTQAKASRDSELGRHLAKGTEVAHEYAQRMMEAKKSE